MFSSKKVFRILILLFLLLLGSCSNQTPLITEELEKVTIQCRGSEELLEVTDEQMLMKIFKEINNSRREGTEEMEFPEGHDFTLETVVGETYGMSVFDNGKLLMKGFYIHSEIPNFCSK